MRLAECAISEIRAVNESGTPAASGTRPAVACWLLLKGRECVQGWMTKDGANYTSFLELPMPLVIFALLT